MTATVGLAQAAPLVVPEAINTQEKLLLLLGAFIVWFILLILTAPLRKKPGPLRGLVSQFRYLFLPALLFFLMTLKCWHFEAVLGDDGKSIEMPTAVYRTAQTVLAAAAVILGLGVINLFFTPQAIRRRGGREVPALLIDVARYLIIIISVAVILHYVWGGQIAPIIGALGVGGVVLGLALQETLSNFFSGLAILADKPFSIGDWIRIGEGREGEVEHMTWRAIRLRTLDNDLVIYPNNLVAKEKVVNFNLPARVEARRLNVGASYKDPPDLVKRTLLDVVADAPGVLQEPRPAVYTVAYGDVAISYEIKFYIEDFGNRRSIEDGIMTRIWYAFRRQGIEIPFPTRNVRVQGISGVVPAAPEDSLPSPTTHEREIAAALAGVPIFKELSPDEQRALSAGADLAQYGFGESVIRQGEPGDTLYAIAAGQARVAVRGQGDTERDVAVLRRGDVFGEMSLLTGEPRSASVYAHGELKVVEVGKAALAPLLSANPDLAKRIAEVVVLRKQGLDRYRAEREVELKKRQEIAAEANNLLGRIRVFFGLLT